MEIPVDEIGVQSAYGGIIRKYEPV